MLLVSCSSDLKFHSCGAQYDVMQIYRPGIECAGGPIRALSWCRDGSLLALVPFKGNAEILRTKDDVKVIQSITGVLQPTATVFQRSTKKNVAIGTAGGSVIVYDLKTRSTRKMFSKSGPQIQMLEWNYKDTHLAVLNADGLLSLYSNTTNQKTNTVKITNNTVSSMRYHQTYKNLLACATNEGSVAVWDNNIGKTKFQAQVHKAPVTDVVFSSQNNSLLTSVALDRSFQCYDTNEGEIALSVLTDQPLSAIDMAPNGHTITVASIRGTIYIYDLRQYSSPIKTVQVHESEIKRILYQPQETGSMESVAESINMTEDKIGDSLTVRRTSSVDSFAQIMNGMSVNEFSPKMDMENKTNILKRCSESLGDSFLAEFSPARKVMESFGADKSNELSNLGITEGVKKWIDSKNNLMDASIPNHSGVLEANKELALSIPTSNSSSTPRLNKLSFMQSQDIQDSPIAMAGGTTTSVNVDEIRKVVREIVTEVTADHMSELMDSLSRYFLNLQLCVSKQFVNQENTFSKMLKSQTQNSNMQAQIENLREENEFLKRKINEMWKKD